MRAVIDTNVVFEGLTKQGGASSLIVKFWEASLFTPCVSTAIILEYYDVCGRLLSPKRWKQTEPILERLLDQVILVNIHYTWRPSSPDPGDDAIIDCAINGRAVIVTNNIKDFRMAELNLGIQVLKPTEFLNLLLENT